MNARYSRGMATPLVLAAILAVAALVGALYYARSRPSMAPATGIRTGTPTQEPAVSQSPVIDAGRIGRFIPSGTVLAGVAAPLIDFNKVDYDKALSEGRIILLYFYANWCPICRAEVPKLYEAFDELTDARIVGFQVNYHDNQTDDDEENMARKYGIGYQHTKVIIVKGQLVLKNGQTWDKDRYLSELEATAR